MNDSRIESKLKVSIIIPIYNAEKYLSECIDSILNQELQQFELILVDDGSTDNSLSVCQSYKEKDKRIQLIHQFNQGVSAARNAGINVAKGEFIAFVDADDWIDRKMYADMYAQAIKYESEVIVCNYIEEYSNQKVYKNHYRAQTVLSKEEKDKFALQLLAGKYLNDPTNITGFRSSCVYLYRRKNIEDHKIRFNQGLPIGEDFVFNLELLLNINNMAIAEGYYYHYRINQTSSMNKYRKNCYQEQIKMIEVIEQVLDEKNLKKQAEKKLKIMKGTYLITRVVNECHKDNPKAYKEKIQVIKEMCSEISIQQILDQIDDTHFTKGRRIWFRLYKNKRAVILYGYYRLIARV